MICKTLTNLLFISLTVLIGNSSTYRRSFESLARLAFEHGVRVNELASCQEPKPQLIYFTDPSKVYLPRATLLHRCSDLTGCCPHVTQTCQPLETQSVDLYFYTIMLKTSGVNTRQVQQFQNIDRITFSNHTRCGCQSRVGYDVDNAIFDDIQKSARKTVYKNSTV